MQEQDYILTMVLQTETFQDEYRLTAAAVNSSHGGCRPDILEVSLCQPLGQHLSTGCVIENMPWQMANCSDIARNASIMKVYKRCPVKSRISQKSSVSGCWQSTCGLTLGSYIPQEIWILRDGSCISATLDSNGRTISNTFPKGQAWCPQ